MTSMPHCSVAQGSKQSTGEDLPIGTLVIRRGLGGIEVRAPVQEGDVISLSATEVQRVATQDDGTENPVYQDSIDPNHPIVITWPSTAPPGDTIRVRSKQVMTKWGLCASHYPHPRTKTQLELEENITYYNDENIRTTIIPPPGLRLRLLPAKLTLEDKNGKSLGNWSVGTGDTVSAVVREHGREFMLPMNSEGIATSEIEDD
jgi:hypothetical protein